MSNYKLFVVIFILLIVLLVACSPAGAEPGADAPADTATPEATQPATETPETESGSDAVTAAAVAHLVGEMGVAEAEIEVVSLEAAEFTDSCLGLGQPNESCLQAITPGWLVMLRAEGQEYEVHTDETGQQVRVGGE